MNETAYIGMGSNQGNRLQVMKKALKRLDESKGVAVSAVSPLYETDPIGGPIQGLYLNACAELKTERQPADLMNLLLNIERELGRVRHAGLPSFYQRWGPRLIDLDLLLYGNIIMKTPVLELPHPRMAERKFVLVPLSDIAAGVPEPKTGKTIATLLKELPETGHTVNLYLKNWFP